MKKITAIMVFVAAIVFAASFAMATPPGKDVTFNAGAMGKVTFSGAVHAKAGLKCNDCHTKIFPMKAPGTPGAAKFTMSDIRAGKYCGECHNGKKAFAPNGNCTKCHKM
ncbi:MAG: cytochrome c3 family protein [Nitrospiraceae bacterium]|nr:cytochrome c3 family protein [Nitrospiraceae bacterium]